MKKLYKLLSATLAISFLVAILVLALTPAPVEAGPSTTWIFVTDSGISDSFDAARKVAKYFCGVPLDYSKPDQDIIIYVSKAGRSHNICRFK